MREVDVAEVSFGCKTGGSGCSFLGGRTGGTGELVVDSVDVSKLQELVTDKLDVWRVIINRPPDDECVGRRLA